MGQQETTRSATAIDATRRYVRVCRQRPDGFVEFEFAIGDPALAVELMLPEAAFHEFCLTNEVIVLDALEPGSGDWVSRLNALSRQEI
ncbi:MAG: phenol hydroxylase subunit [Bacteroidota bacterium]